MEFKTRKNERIVLAGGVRTPIGQAGKSYADIPSYELGYIVTEEIFRRTGVPKSAVSGVVAGEIGQSCFAPNVARVISVRANLPLQATAITVQNNCVSGFEAVFDAARRILVGEGDFYLALGMESMSQGALILTGAKKHPKTSTAEKINGNWAEAPEHGVKVVDSIDEGLNDPIRNLNMAMTGEVVAQRYSLTKKDLDTYAFKSYKKALDAVKAGKYRPYQVAVDTPDGKLEDDEYIMTKTGMVDNPGRFDKASVIFDSKYMSIREFYEKYGEWIGKPFVEGQTQAAVTLFNACPRSDGAGAIFVTTESRAKELGLPIQAVLSGWGMYGVDPSVMGIGMAGAMNAAVQNTGSRFDELDYFEIHEAFAATALGTMKEVHASYGYDLPKANEEGRVNPHGGTLALGHPLGATGIRVLLNMIMNFEQFPNAKKQIGVICAGGGVAGSALLERV